MIGMTFLTVSIVVFAAMVAAVSVAVSRTAVAEPVVVSPFNRVGSVDPAADTLAGGTHCSVFPPAQPGEWQILTCDTLREVEDTLDSLEGHGIREREVVCLSNACFAVRWKC